MKQKVFIINSLEKGKARRKILTGLKMDKVAKFAKFAKSATNEYMEPLTWRCSLGALPTNPEVFFTQKKEG